MKLSSYSIILFFTLFFWLSPKAYSNDNAHTYFLDQKPEISILTNAPTNLRVCGNTSWYFETDFRDGERYEWKVLNSRMVSFITDRHQPRVEVLIHGAQSRDQPIGVAVEVVYCQYVLRDTLMLLVKGIPNYKITSSEREVCDNEPVVFSVAPSPVGFSEITWNFGSGDLKHDTVVTHVFPHTHREVKYAPRLTIENPEGCPETVIKYSDSITVKPAPRIYLTPPALYPRGDFQNTLHAVFSDTANSAINWYANGKTLLKKTDNHLMINKPGVYQARIENASGCYSFSNKVNVVESCTTKCDITGPNLHSFQSEQKNADTLHIQLNYSPAEVPAIKEFWVFPEGVEIANSTIGTQAMTDAIFSKPGYYDFQYVLEYPQNCKKTFSHQVFVPVVNKMEYSVSCAADSALYSVSLRNISDVFPGEMKNIKFSFAYKTNGKWVEVKSVNEHISITLPHGKYRFKQTITHLASNQDWIYDTGEIHLPKRPQAQFETITEPVCRGDVPVKFTSHSTPSDVAHLWDFDGLGTLNLINPVRTFDTDMGVLTHLTVTNKWGCSSRIHKNVWVVNNMYYTDDYRPVVISDSRTIPTPGQSVVLNFLPDPAFVPPALFVWHKGSIPITDTTSRSSIEVTTPGSYWAMGIGEHGCMAPSYSVWINFEIDSASANEEELALLATHNCPNYKPVFGRNPKQKIDLSYVKRIPAYENNKLNIQYRFYRKEGAKRLEVIDANETVIHSLPIVEDSGRTMVDFSKLSRGVYTVAIFAANKKITQTRVSVNPND